MRIQDHVNPGSGKEKSDPGSGINIPDIMKLLLKSRNRLNKRLKAIYMKKNERGAQTLHTC
jgi:hypothetical protein